MKRMVRFAFIVVVMLAYYIAYNIFFSPVIEQIAFEGVGIADESAMLILAVITEALAAVIFIFLYIRWYIAVPEHKREFLKRIETVDYDMKTDIIYHMEENNGNIDILIYALYSVPMPLSIWFFKGTSPVIFLYFQQLIFYTVGITNIFVVNLVFSYMCSVLFFIAGYIIGIALLHKIWHKTRLRK